MREDLMKEYKRVKAEHITNGDIQTNFGWLTSEQVENGLAWGAVTWGYKKQGILSIKSDKGSRPKKFDVFSVWLAYLEKERGSEHWYKHLQRRAKPEEGGTIDDVALVSLFTKLTGISVPLEGNSMW